MKPHGHPTRYHAGCRCVKCKEARRREGKRERAKAGLDTQVPASFARSYIKRLGVPHRGVARAAGLHYTSLDKVMSGKQKTLRLSTVNKILAVKEVQPELFDAHFVDATQTKEMLRDLELSGFSNREIQRKLGVKAVLAGKSRVRLWNARRIERFYRRAGIAA